MGTSIQILYLGVVHKLQILVIQNMLTMGESRDMSRIYIALQALFIKCWMEVGSIFLCTLTNAWSQNITSGA